MRLLLFLCLFFLGSNVLIFGQQRGMTFQEAESSGIRISFLDSTFKSAVHADTAKAVFKTVEDQELLSSAYVKMLQDLGNHLEENGFHWNEPTRCFNRIYFNSDGTIAYFLFNFIGATNEEKPSREQQEAFKQLLNDFIRDYKFGMTADTKFAQCSPTTYMPPKE